MRFAWYKMNIASIIMNGMIYNLFKQHFHKNSPPTYTNVGGDKITFNYYPFKNGLSCSSSTVVYGPCPGNRGKSPSNSKSLSLIESTKVS